MNQGDIEENIENQESGLISMILVKDAVSIEVEAKMSFIAFRGFSLLHKLMNRADGCVVSPSI